MTFRLLSVSSDAKTIKGEKKGFLTGVLYLAPAKEAGGPTVCPSSTPECERACLYRAGKGGMHKVAAARIRKTKLMQADRAAFIAILCEDILALCARAEKLGFTPCVRLNGTSDQPQLARELARRFPAVQFYDYTKIPNPWKRTLPNYHLTFSFSGANLAEAEKALSHGINAAVVFDTPKGAALPHHWRGRHVLDGDLNDLRFLDPAGSIVGLRAKGPARKQKSDFIQIGG